jgi:hypothetical protein
MNDTIDITDPSERARMTALDPVAYPDGWADGLRAYYGGGSFRPADPALQRRLRVAKRSDR